MAPLSQWFPPLPVHQPAVPLQVHATVEMDAVRAFIETLDAALGEDSLRPQRVADVLRRLDATGKVKNDLAKAALLLGAQAGRFTLEPESGMGRLSESDAALCPAGPRGTVLSWFRRHA
jgi:hypothetical protein